MGDETKIETRIGSVSDHAVGVVHGPVTINPPGRPVWPWLLAVVVVAVMAFSWHRWPSPTPTPDAGMPDANPPPPPPPVWRCEPPSGRVFADCEVGGLKGKNVGRKAMKSYGTLATDTFCHHSAPNRGYAQVTSECDPVTAGQVASITMGARIDLFGKAGFTDSDDCRGDGGSRDKCWTRAEYVLDARASLVVPSTGAIELQVDVHRCPKDFAVLSGTPIKLEAGARGRLQGGEVLTLRLKGDHLLDTTDTNGKTYKRECAVRLSLVPVAR